MGIGDVIRWNKLGLKLNRVKSAVEKESKEMQYDAWKTVGKGFKALLLSVLAVGAAAGIGTLADPEFVKHALEGTASPAIVAVLVPVITSAANMYLNYRKHNGE